MIKRLFSLFFALLLLLSCGLARAEGFDFTPYEFSAPFIVSFMMLDSHNLVAECWETSDGAVDEPLYLTWWRDGEIIRQISYSWEDGGYDLLQRQDGTCGVLKARSDGGHIDTAPGAYGIDTTRLFIYDWEDEGLVNERLLAEGVMDYRVAKDGVALMKMENGTSYLYLFDGQGRQEGKLPMEPGYHWVVRAARDHEGLWMVTVEDRMKGAAYRPILIRNGEILWEGAPGASIYNVRMDEQGGYFLTEHVPGQTYSPVFISRYDGNGNKLWQKKLSGKNVNLGTITRIDPVTGHLIIAGSAKAKSRNLHRVYRLEVDENWHVVSLDVRDCRRDENDSVSVYLSPQADEILVFIRPDNDGRHPVLVPFDALPQADDPGITLN